MITVITYFNLVHYCLSITTIIAIYKFRSLRLFKTSCFRHIAYWLLIQFQLLKRCGVLSILVFSIQSTKFQKRFFLFFFILSWAKRWKRITIFFAIAQCTFSSQILLCSLLVSQLGRWFLSPLQISKNSISILLLGQPTFIFWRVFSIAQLRKIRVTKLH